MQQIGSAQSIQQILQQIGAARKQGLASVSLPDQPQDQTKAPALPSTVTQSLGSNMQDMAAASRAMGYDKNTMMGYNLGGAGAGSLPAGNGNALSMIAGDGTGGSSGGGALSAFSGDTAGTAASAAPSALGSITGGTTAAGAGSAATGAAASGIWDGLWDAIWSMI